MKKSFDTILLLLLVALGLTLLLFALGIFPYPFGFVVLAAFIIGRWLSIKGPEKNP